MTILNITFHVHVTVRRAFTNWLCDTWVPAARSAGMHTPRLARVVGGDDPDGMSLAFEMAAPTLSVARQWFEGSEAHALRLEISRNWGQQVVFFATYLQTENL